MTHFTPADVDDDPHEDNLRARLAARRARIQRTNDALAAADRAFGPSQLDRWDGLGPTPAQVTRISDAMAGIPPQSRRRPAEPVNPDRET